MKTAKAISYIRFSGLEQRKGDSLRRQTEDAETWCKRNGIGLDASLSMKDMGVSGYKGKNRSDSAALGQFLKACKAGRVPRGSYLIIENLDRLSREEERTALRLWLDILDHGINIVQLTPETVFRHERTDMADVMRAIIELSRGHSESKMKSERLGKVWAEKRRIAVNGSHRLTGRTPAWIKPIYDLSDPKRPKVKAFSLIRLCNRTPEKAGVLLQPAPFHCKLGSRKITLSGCGSSFQNTGSIPSSHWL